MHNQSSWYSETTRSVMFFWEKLPKRNKLMHFNYRKTREKIKDRFCSFMLIQFYSIMKKRYTNSLHFPVHNEIFWVFQLFIRIKVELRSSAKFTYFTSEECFSNVFKSSYPSRNMRRMLIRLCLNSASNNFGERFPRIFKYINRQCVEVVRINASTHARTNARTHKRNHAPMYLYINNKINKQLIVIQFDLWNTACLNFSKLVHISVTCLMFQEPFVLWHINFFSIH